MNDNFYPSVTWDTPISEGTSAHLTHIVRDQSFITWLAAVNETTKDVVVLSTVRWRFYLEIYIDPSKELGQRILFMSPRLQKQPLITNGNEKTHSLRSSTIRSQLGNKNNHNKTIGQIPISALVRPSANYAQTLIWRPSNGDPVVIVPPKELHEEKSELVFYNNLSAYSQS